MGGVDLQGAGSPQLTTVSHFDQGLPEATWPGPSGSSKRPVPSGQVDVLSATRKRRRRTGAARTRDRGLVTAL